MTITLDDLAGTPRNITNSVTSIGGMAWRLTRDVTTLADAVKQYLAAERAAYPLSRSSSNTLGAGCAE